MENSLISWTDHTFNPFFGCAPVSPGCVNCYAEALMDVRLGKVTWGKGQPRVRTSPANWALPKRWNKAAEHLCACESSHNLPGGQCGDCGLWTRRPRVFCASLADWLDAEVPIAWLADLLALIQATPHLDWLLLTKRPQNFASRIWQAFLWASGDDQGNEPRDRSLMNWLAPVAHYAIDGTGGEPWPNVWIGTTVEDQPRADERIPALLKIPAHLRFLSCEPLLSEVNLAAVFSVWDYCGSCGTSFDYLPGREDVCPECHIPNCMCAGFGSALRNAYDEVEGHIEIPDGSPIHWVICGGESGPQARPMNPDWARHLRDQCAAADVPFHFKQWGEWVRDADIHTGCEISQSTIVQYGDGDPANFRRVYRVGKKKAGRLLDGITHDAFPTPANHATFAK